MCWKPLIQQAEIIFLDDNDNVDDYDDGISESNTYIKSSTEGLDLTSEVETDASIGANVMDVDTFVKSSSDNQELRADTVTSNEISILEVDQQIDCTFDRLSTCLGHQSVVDEAPDAESMLMEPDVNDPSFEPDPEDYDSSDSVDNVDDEEGNKSLLNNIPDILDDECPKRKRSTKYDVNKNKWHENKNRLKREKGESYVGKKKKMGNGNIMF
nr:unnamed protein product [Callosobruchus chinensis]